jgi:putative membrane protein
MLRNIKRSVILTTAAISCALPVWSQTPETPGTTTTTTEPTQTKADHKTTAFLKEAARDNDAEIALAEVGVRQAQNAELKSYCEMLQKEHTQVSKDLEAIAQKSGAGTNQALTWREKREVARFEKLSGTQFDQKFAEQILSDHQKTISKYDKAAQELQAGDGKQYAVTMLPKLREHFEKASELARTVGVDASTISSITKKLPAVGGTGDASETLKGAGEKDQPADTSKDLPKDETPKH